MENQGLISVIIPVYNVERYLRECVESVLNQTYQNYEVILVDDGSTDTSGAICDEYLKIDDRIQVIHQQNGGLSIARNTGISKAQGEYVYFLDSDDWIEPKALERLQNVAEKESAQIVFMDAKSFVDDSRDYCIKQRYVRKTAYSSTTGYDMLGKLQKDKDYHSAVQLLFINRNFLHNISVRFFPGIVYEDMLFTYEIFCKAKKVAHLPEALYHRRYRSGSIMTSRKTKKNYESAVTVYQETRRVSEQAQLLQEKIARDYVSRCAFNALGIYKKLNGKERQVCKTSYKQLKKNILEYDAYKNKALKARCYGVFPWFCYKICQKLLRL